MVVQRGMAAPAGVEEEDADLAVIDLAQPAAPLPIDAAGFDPLLGETAGVDDEDGAAVAPLGADVAAEFGQQGVVIPGTVADEFLDGPAVDAGVVGDGLGGLALEAREALPRRTTAALARCSERRNRGE